MHKIIYCVFISVFVSVPVALSQKMTRMEYINTYQDLAVKEMQRTGIPASITLAQGILESGDGNSTLAKKGKNHFGIKCHSDWEGKKVYHDDDLKNECFRKYKSVYESYQDHSDFLTTRTRYQFLFDLELTDYKAWAKGLKKAGYATSSTYADVLIRIIEENQLYRFDDSLFASRKIKEDNNVEKVSETETVNFQLNNNVKYIYAKAGDNLEIIAQRHGKLPFELARYNEMQRSAELNEGQVIYLQPKRKNASRGFNFHEVKEGETMHSISQLYGIKLKHLYIKNQMDEGSEPEVGQKLWLRKKKKGTPKIDLNISEPEQEEDVNFEVEFEG